MLHSNQTGTSIFLHVQGCEGIVGAVRHSWDGIYLGSQMTGTAKFVLKLT